MPLDNHLLTDVAQGVHLDTFERSGETNSAKWTVHKHTLRGGRSDGVDVIEVDNGRLAFSVLPTRGMGIWQAECDDMTIGWDSPVKLPVHPSQVNLAEWNGLGWLGGFNEWLCRCGLGWHGAPGEDNGVPLNLHGKIANTPAHEVHLSTPSKSESTEDDPQYIEITGLMDETALFLANLRLESTLVTFPGSNAITIVDTITNIGGKPTDVELLYHINTGRPFLEGGARCEIPIRKLAPRDAHAADDLETWNTFNEPVAGYAEQCYFFEPAADADGNTTSLLMNKAADKAISISFNTSKLPYFTLWKNTQAEADGYVAGLEPSTSFPNGRSFERQQGRVISLEPGASHQNTLRLAIHATAAEVAEMRKQVAAIQSAAGDPQIFATPQAEYSPS